MKAPEDGASAKDRFLAGALLIAMPGIGDPRFEQAVVLLCAHSADHALGVRLNLPAQGLTLTDLLARLNVEGRPRDPDQPVLLGGPVEQERGYVLHSDDYEAAGVTMKVAPGVRLTATRDVLEAMTDRHVAPRRAVLALGYAGWGPGQLEAELVQNVWLTGPADPELVFGQAHADKWRRALAAIGVRPDALSVQGGRA